MSGFDHPLVTRLSLGLVVFLLILGAGRVAWELAGRPSILLRYGDRAEDVRAEPGPAAPRGEASTPASGRGAADPSSTPSTRASASPPYGQPGASDIGAGSPGDGGRGSRPDRRAPSMGTKVPPSGPSAAIDPGENPDAPSEGWERTPPPTPRPKPPPTPGPSAQDLERGSEPDHIRYAREPRGPTVKGAVSTFGRADDGGVR